MYAYHKDSTPFQKNVTAKNDFWGRTSFNEKIFFMLVFTDILSELVHKCENLAKKSRNFKIMLFLWDVLELTFFRIDLFIFIVALLGDLQSLVLYLCLLIIWPEGAESLHNGIKLHTLSDLGARLQVDRYNDSNMHRRIDTVCVFLWVEKHLFICPTSNHFTEI